MSSSPPIEPKNNPLVNRNVQLDELVKKRKAMELQLKQQQDEITARKAKQWIDEQEKEKERQILRQALSTHKEIEAGHRRRLYRQREEQKSRREATLKRLRVQAIVEWDAKDKVRYYDTVYVDHAKRFHPNISDAERDAVETELRKEFPYQAPVETADQKRAREHELIQKKIEDNPPEPEINVEDVVDVIYLTKSERKKAEIRQQARAAQDYNKMQDKLEKERANKSQAQRENELAMAQQLIDRQVQFANLIELDPKQAIANLQIERTEWQRWISLAVWYHGHRFATNVRDIWNSGNEGMHIKPNEPFLIIATYGGETRSAFAHAVVPQNVSYVTEAQILVEYYLSACKDLDIAFSRDATGVVSQATRDTVDSETASVPNWTLENNDKTVAIDKYGKRIMQKRLHMLNTWNGPYKKSMRIDEIVCVYFPIWVYVNYDEVTATEKIRGGPSNSFCAQIPVDSGLVDCTTQATPHNLRCVFDKQYTKLAKDRTNDLILLPDMCQNCKGFMSKQVCVRVERKLGHRECSYCPPTEHVHLCSDRCSSQHNKLVHFSESANREEKVKAKKQKAQQRKKINKQTKKLRTQAEADRQKEANDAFQSKPEEEQIEDMKEQLVEIGIEHETRSLRMLEIYLANQARVLGKDKASNEENKEEEEENDEEEVKQSE